MPNPPKKPDTYIVKLNVGANRRAIEQEEKARFLRATLEQVGVDTTEFWTYNEGDPLPFSVDMRENLRKVYEHYNIQVLDQEDGSIEIYVDGSQVAKWSVIQYILKPDLEQLDPRKRVYLEAKYATQLFIEHEETP
jgi:hypothetical protein